MKLHLTKVASLFGCGLLLGLSVVPSLTAGDSASLVLTEKGKSSYVIYHSEKAPQSVKTAAEEIQRVIEISTGVKLEIVHEPTATMICLGDNESARNGAVMLTA